MAAAITHAFKPTRTGVLTLVTILAILFGSFGLISAKQARGADTLSKQVWAGVKFDGTLVHGKHVTGVVRTATGQYTVTFDRHVDNCSLQVTPRFEQGALSGRSFATLPPGGSTFQTGVYMWLYNGTAVNNDFDIFGMCPSS